MKGPNLLARTALATGGYHPTLIRNLSWKCRQNQRFSFPCLGFSSSSMMDLLLESWGPFYFIMYLHRDGPSLHPCSCPSFCRGRASWAPRHYIHLLCREENFARLFLAVPSHVARKDSHRRPPSSNIGNEIGGEEESLLLMQRRQARW